MIGPPLWICFSKRGITDPVDPSTLPKRRILKFVLEFLLIIWIYFSQSLFVAPIIFEGLTALSVDINIILGTLNLIHIFEMFTVDKKLFFRASKGSDSTKVICFKAAA